MQNEDSNSGMDVCDKGSVVVNESSGNIEVDSEKNNDEDAVGNILFTIEEKDLEETQKMLQRNLLLSFFHS